MKRPLFNKTPSDKELPPKKITQRKEVESDKEEKEVKLCARRRVAEILEQRELKKHLADFD